MFYTCFKDSALRSIAVLLIGNNSKETDNKLKKSISFVTNLKSRKNG
jgi:hypothetical protein